MFQNLNPCEICGKHSKLVDVIIEGTLLSVCPKCTKFGKVVLIKKEEKIKEEVPRKIEVQENIEFIVDNYNELIKKARERLDLKQKELAEKIAEKESLIQHIEAKNIKPSFQLARKLEKFLDVKLIEIYKEPEKKVLDLRDASLTIGDLLKLKGKNEL